ncbi:MAG: hypothetical protein KF845_08705 [Cyclobacteriaceae bacterium]|nr:hypothetical protein [Cyclobacteriaceae bacterium]
MKKVAIFFFIIPLLFTCSEYEEFNGVPIRQYAGSVIDFSSQYTTGDWSAAKALGKEDVYDESKHKNGYGDNINAWSSLTADGQREYLVLGFDTLQTVQIVEVYETWYPGAIDTVYIRNTQTQKWEIVYSKPASTDLPDTARVFRFFLPLETTYLADAIRLAINSPAVEGWNEIDAVAITGQRSKQD